METNVESKAITIMELRLMLFHLEHFFTDITAEYMMITQSLPKQSYIIHLSST